jgi:hypothetical protein
VSDTLVLVEPLAGPPRGGPWRLQTSLRPRGLDATSDHLLIHDGDAAEVYEVSRSGDGCGFERVGRLDARGAGTGAATMQRPAGGGGGGGSGEGVREAPDGGGGTGNGVATAAAAAAAMALIAESVFRLAGDRVEVCNFGGARKAWGGRGKLVSRCHLVVRGNLAGWGFGGRARLRILGWHWHRGRDHDVGDQPER